MNKWYNNLSPETKKNIVQTVTYAVLLIISVVSIGYISKKMGVSFLIVGTPSNTTGTINNNTGTDGLVTPPPSTPGVTNIIAKDKYREDLSKLSSATERVAYILKNGVEGEDYIIAIPYPPQPDINGEKDENNHTMWNYLYKYRSEIVIPTGVEKGYVMFVTTKQVDDSREIYLGIYGDTQGAIKKNQSLWNIESEKNKYLFDMNSTPVEDFPNPINLFNETRNGRIQIGAFAAQQSNKVEQIIMFFY